MREIDKEKADKYVKNILERRSVMPYINRYERESYRLDYEGMCKSNMKFGK